MAFRIACSPLSSARDFCAPPNRRRAAGVRKTWSGNHRCLPSLDGAQGLEILASRAPDQGNNDRLGGTQIGSQQIEAEKGLAPPKIPALIRTWNEIGSNNQLSTRMKIRWQSTTTSRSPFSPFPPTSTRSVYCPA